ncbi:SubName: Full=Uncharacterized protein {ECO:0000313/EMBL:CCA70840.1} [Serendipita indica DSM 11827]|nr:SubName: Full=Uncharacterized protein {ECO:0000313/EMBL:CCA70840.1} [Serendipita indica DSM 11827]
MAARKATARMEIDSAQLQAWHLAYASLSELAKIPDVSDALSRANKYLQQFQLEYHAQDQTASELKPTRNKVKKEIGEIREHSRMEIERCDKALEQLQKIASSRTSVDTSSSQTDGRPKRTRESSMAPQQTSTASNIASNASSAAQNSLTLVLRPPLPPFSQEVWMRIQKQLPLQPGRKVAFRVPSDKTGKSSVSPTGNEGVGYEEDAWILATVFKAEKKDKQDVESETGEPPKYTTTIKSLIPLPIVDTSPSDPSHLGAYPEYQSGSIVLALFPDTTSFYKAEVVASPKDIQVAGNRTAPAAAKATPSYKVRFEDDDDQVRLVSAEEVIDFPGY